MILGPVRPARMTDSFPTPHRGALPRQSRFGFIRQGKAPYSKEPPKNPVMNKRKLNRELCSALTSNDADKLKRLIALGADINSVRSGRETFVPLWMAVNGAGQEISNGFRELGEGLAELLPNMKPRDPAAKRGDWLRSVDILLAAKADVNRLSHGSTPLRIAVHWEDLVVVQILLAHGANANAECFSIFSKLTKKEGRKTVPGYYNTVLHEAVEKDSLPIAEVLLAAGADPNRTDHEGKTPLALAQDKGLSHLIALLQNRPAVQPGWRSKA